MRINPFKNLALKISAIALASLLWVHVATNRTYEYQIDIPIRIVDIPEDLLMVSHPGEVLPVTIKATGKQLISMALGHPEIDISAADYSSGNHEREIEENDVLAALKHPYESFEMTIPVKLNLRFENKVEKMVPVRARNVVKPALGFAVMGPLQVEPESVLVTGPSAFVSRLRYIETDSTEFLEVDKSLQEKIALQVPDSLMLTLSDSVVTVSTDVEAKRQKMFSGVAITPPRNFSTDKFAIVPDTISFVLEIPESQIDSFGVDDLVISFKRPPILQDSVKAAVRWLLPDNVRVVGPMLDSLLIVSKS